MTIAVLKEDGNIPSESERFMILVIGGSRESMHDFRSFMGIRSSEHVAFEAERRKSERGGGALEGGGFRFRTRAGVRGVNLAQRFVILSSKNCRKADAREEGQVVFGRDGGGLR